MMKKFLAFILALICAFTFTGCSILDDLLEKFGLSDQPNLPDINAAVGNLTNDDIQVIGNSDFSIHFLEVGNEYTGDCTYVKAGDVDILIDAGSRKNSASTIINYVDQFCTDNTLEYVIATHAHQDHIAGFGGLASSDGIFDHYKTEIIIDYALTNATSQIKTQY